VLPTVSKEPENVKRPLIAALVVRGDTTESHA
jgi:hypothetical protein